MVVSMEHIVSTLIMSTAIIRLFQWKWDHIVATLGTNPYVYKVQSLIETLYIDKILAFILLLIFRTVADVKETLPK